MSQQSRRAESEALPPRATLGTGRLVVQHVTVARFVEALAVAWYTANSAVLAERFSNEMHVEVEATWGIYQRMITAYWDPDPDPEPDADCARGREAMRAVIASISSRVPAALREI